MNPLTLTEAPSPVCIKCGASDLVKYECGECDGQGGYWHRGSFLEPDEFETCEQCDGAGWFYFCEGGGEGCGAEWAPSDLAEQALETARGEWKAQGVAA